MASNRESVRDLLIISILMALAFGKLPLRFFPIQVPNSLNIRHFAEHAARFLEIKVRVFNRLRVARHLHIPPPEDAR